MQVEKMTAEQLIEAVGLFAPCMDDYLFVYDCKKDYYQISPRAMKRFLLPADHFTNALEEHTKFVYPEDVSVLVKELDELSRGIRTTHNMHYRWLDRENKPIWINCRGRVLLDSDGTPHFLVGCINEIGEKQKADNVSGLLGESSMRAYYEGVDGIFPEGFMLRIGIDDFKDINENNGVEYGDFILRKTAECINKSILPGQKLFRIVADEFAVVDFLGGTVTDARKLYRDIRMALAEFVEENQYKAVYTISGGILPNEAMEDSFENVMKFSEFALSEAKKTGKNSVWIFDKEAYDKYLKKRHLLQLMHRAVNHEFQGFETFFQPLVNAADGQLSGAEALLRFRLQDGTMISPGEFIPILEESGLIIPVGRWVLREALRECKEWQKYVPNFKVNVNLSYVQMLKSQVLNDIVNIVEEYGVNPSSVCIELTESGYLEDNTRFNKVWNGLKDYGVLLALDDFGTGYSNLHCLSDLKPAYIKIDRSFMLKALNKEYEYRLLNSIVEMSHSLGLHVCMEGIETEIELERARTAEPDYIQGFLFGKPCDGESFFKQFVVK